MLNRTEIEDETGRKYIALRGETDDENVILRGLANLADGEELRVREKPGGWVEFEACGEGEDEAEADKAAGDDAEAEDGEDPTEDDGGGETDDYAELDRDKLAEKCAERGLEHGPKAKHATLVKLLRAADAGSDE